MWFFEDVEIGSGREFGSFTFTADEIKRFAGKYDPQRFHLSEEEGRKSLFGRLACRFRLHAVDDPQCATPRQGSGGARGNRSGVGTVAGFSRLALDQAC